MVWIARKSEEGRGGGGGEQVQRSSQVSAIGNIFEIESLQNYVLTFEKGIKDGNMLKLVIEDRINRYDLKFINPHLDKNNNDILYAQGEKGMFAAGAPDRITRKRRTIFCCKDTRIQGEEDYF